MSTNGCNKPEGLEVRRTTSGRMAVRRLGLVVASVLLVALLLWCVGRGTT